MGNVCKKMAIVYGVLGILASIWLAGVLGKSVTYFGRSERNMGLTLAIFAGSAFSVLMITFALYTLGEIYDIVSGISYKTTSMNHMMESSESDKKKISKGGWTCPDCGRINNSYDTTCRCGRSKNA